MKQYLTYGPLVIELRDFLQENMWCHWYWKLDAFRCPETKSPDIIIEKSTKSYSTNQLLYEEQTGFFIKQYYLSENGYIWQLSRKKSNHIIVQYYISDDWRNIKLIKDESQSYGFASFEFLGSILSFSVIQFSILSFHGVFMEYMGKGILICASSETGKTTHARLWRDEKHSLIINGDKSCCYKKNNQWIGFGIPWSGTSGENINRSVPISNIVILERADHNYAEILDSYVGIQKLFPHLLCPQWDLDFINQSINLLEDLAQNVRFIQLQCLPNKEATDTLLEVIQ